MQPLSASALTDALSVDTAGSRSPAQQPHSTLTSPATSSPASAFSSPRPLPKLTTAPLQAPPSYPPLTLQPRLAFTSSDLSPHCYTFLNDRTLLFPIGQLLFKLDLPLPPTPDDPSPPPTLQFLCKRHSTHPPILSLSPCHRRLAIIEPPPSPPPLPPSSSTKLLISVIDLTTDPLTPLCPTFTHTHVGRCMAVDWSVNGAILAVHVDWEGEDVRRRKPSTAAADLQALGEGTGGGSRPGSEGERGGEGGEGGGGAAKASRWSSFRQSLITSRPASTTSQPPSSASPPLKTPRYRGALSLWRLDTRKVLTTHLTPHLIHSIALHPDDPYLIAAVGMHYLRHIRVVGGRCEEVGLMKRLLERVYVLRGCRWVEGGELVVRGETELTVFKGTAIKQVMQVTSTAAITSLQPTPTSLLVATDDGALHSYARNSSPTKLTQNLLYLPPVAWPLHAHSLQSMRLNQAGTMLVLCVEGVGLCSVGLGDEVEKVLAPQVRVTSPVTCIHASEARGVVVTGHADHSLSVYRHLATSSSPLPPAIHHVFAEPPLALAVHRDGHHLLAVFPSQVGFFHLLHTSVKLSHSVCPPTRIVHPCHVAYSHGHDRWALTTGVHCFVYCAHTLQLLHHVQSVAVVGAVGWTGDDSVLVTATLEGGVMGYDRHMTRVVDEVEKGVEYVTLDTDWGPDYPDLIARRIKAQLHTPSSSSTPSPPELLTPPAVILTSGVHNGVTNRLRWITRRGGHGVGGGREVAIIPPTQMEGEAGGLAHMLRHVVLTRIVIDVKRGVVVATTSSGYVLLLSYPLQTDVEPRVHLLHAAALHEQAGIAHLEYLQQSGTLVTVGSDGHLLVTDIRTLEVSHSLHAAPAPSPPIASLTPFNLSRPKLVPRALPSPLPVHAPLTPFGPAYSSDPEVIQLRLSAYLHLLSQCKSGEAVMKKVEKTAEYQLNAQKDYYVSHLRLLRGEMAGVLAKKQTEVEGWRKMWKKNEGEKERVKDEYERERERLELKMRAHAEKRLHEHTLLHEDKCRELERERQERAGREAELEARLRAMKDEYESRLQSQQSTLSARISELTSSLSVQERQYEEALVQLEAEYDRELLLMRNQTTTQLSKHRENTAILVAEMSAAKRKLDEKQSNLSNLELVVAEQDDNLHHTSAVIRKLTATVASSKQQLRLKEEDITRRQYELAGARQDNTVLKNFIEILEHRIAELENREAPALDALMTMKGRIEHMSGELFALNAKNIEARGDVKRKRGESERLYASVTSLRHQLAKREQWIEGVKKEMKFLVDHASNGSANERLHVDVRKLYTQLFTGEKGEEGEEDEDEVRMQNRVAAEIDRQRKYLEKSVTGMKKGLDSLQVRKKREGEKALQQNIHFLYEVNRLREDNKRLEGKVQAYRGAMQRAGLTKQLQHMDVDVTPGVTLPPTAAPAAKAVEREEKEGVEAARGELVLGSTRPLWDLCVERRQEAELYASLEASHEVVERQRVALLQLQRGVEQAIDIAQRRWYEVEALRRRMKEMQGVAPTPKGEEMKITVEGEAEEQQQPALWGRSSSPFKHAKMTRSPAGGVVLPSLATPGTLSLYSNTPPPNSLEAKLATLTQPHRG